MSDDIRLAGLETECERLRGLNTQLAQQIAILKAEADAMKSKRFLDTIIDAAKSLNDAHDQWESDARTLFIRNQEITKRDWRPKDVAMEAAK